MLIIWDFDGVICDSDDIWAENWCKLLKSEKDIEISEQEKRELLIGISEKDKAQRLEDHFSGLKIDAAFKKKLNKLHDFGFLLQVRGQLRILPGSSVYTSAYSLELESMKKKKGDTSIPRAGGEEVSPFCFF